MGRKKTSLKHCYLHGILTCPYFLGPENGVRFLRRFSFRCGVGSIFVALFVKSSFGTCTVNTSYITGLDMCKVCTEAVHSVALWTRVTSQVWTCVKYVPKQSIPWHFENVPFYTYGFQSVSKNLHLSPGFVCPNLGRYIHPHDPRLRTPHPWDLYNTYICPSASLVAECQDIHISRCTTQRGTLEACGTQQHPLRAFRSSPHGRDERWENSESLIW